MNRLLLVPPSLSFLLLAAHALRLGEAWLGAAWILGLGMVWSGRDWMRLVAATALGLGLFLWLDAGAGLAAVRRALGEPWLRLAAIMGVAALCSGASALLLLTRRAQRLFPKGRDQGIPQAAAFALTAGFLVLARARSPVPVLLADRFAPGSGWMEILLLAAYAAWILGLMLDPARVPALRPRLWALFSLAFFGQLALGLLGADQALMTGRLHLPVPALIAAGPAYRGHGLFMPLLFLASAILAGPAWCSHLCYLGAWDDRCSRLLRRPPRPLPAWTRAARPAALALTLGAALILRAASAPPSVAAALAALFGLGGVAVMLAVSARLGRMVHCTAYCPMGFLAALLGRLSPWRLRIATGCVQCGACSTVCRYGALEPAHLARRRPGASCTLCGDCLAACPRSLLAYRFPGLSPHTARTAFLVTVLSLHAAFLGMARI